jgi:hypothetical protein
MRGCRSRNLGKAGPITNEKAARGTDRRRRPNLPERRPRALDETPPRVRERHAARCPREEHDAELLFELAHRLADRGSRDTELARRRAEAVVARDGQECLELRERGGVHGAHIRLSRIA